jgi:pyruvate, water dikinase
MSHSNKAIVWFNEVGKQDVASVGGKGANLGELTQAQIPVPQGFIVTAYAYYDFLAETAISDQIVRMLSVVDRHDSKQLQQVAEEVQQVILKSEVPAELVKSIKEAYRKMGRGLVAVRSSATAEDLPDASFAGQQSTFLNIEGENQVVEAIKACWASLFNARAIFYRSEQNYDHLKVGIAVPVQRMVQSQVSGVMFTLEPVTSDQDKITIEAVYGLGEAIVSGEVTPDLFIIDKKTLKIVNKKISKQEWQLIKNPNAAKGEANIKQPIPLALQISQKISDEEVLQLATLGSNIEKHYHFPQDIEWAKENGQLFITQARPVTTIKSADPTAPKVDLSAAAVLLIGSPASPGMAAGPVKIIAEASQIDKIMKGDILVAEMTTPDFVPAMKRAAAILTDQGGRTSHAAIVSRELGIPCVVGSTHATRILKDGQLVTVDGSSGKVYQGNVVPSQAANLVQPRAKSAVKTQTKVYVNLAQPDLAEKIAARNVDGVGLLRAEFIMGQIGEHPRYMIGQGRGKEYIEKLYQGVNTIAKAFYPRPVVYRAADFKTNEYRNLKGGMDYEPVEENPMLGYRGATRYVREPDVFQLEIEAIKRVRQQYDNLYVMIPFVRTVDNLADCRKILAEQGLVGSRNFKLWMMVEIPANIFLMDQFVDVGIDGISIGSNDLTQLILGTDRDSQKLATVFDERNEAVMMAIEMAVKTAKKRGITCSICGQAPSVYPELTEKLVNWGITSVSVSPDMIDVTRDIIADIESKK